METIYGVAHTTNDEYDKNDMECKISTKRHGVSALHRMMKLKFRRTSYKVAVWCRDSGCFALVHTVYGSDRTRIEQHVPSLTYTHVLRICCREREHEKTYQANGKQGIERKRRKRWKQKKFPNLLPCETWKMNAQKVDACYVRCEFVVKHLRSETRL